MVKGHFIVCPKTQTPSSTRWSGSSASDGARARRIGDCLRDGEDPTRFLELFEVPSWDVHARQHEGRLTGSDAEAEQEAFALANRIAPRHYFPAEDVTGR